MAREWQSNSTTHTEENDGCREGRDDSREPALLHDRVHHWNSETAQDGRERTQPNIRDVCFCVAVANVLEAEVTVVANKPASQTEEELRERGMHVEVVLSEDVV